MTIMRDVQETHLLTKCLMKRICGTLFPPKMCLCSLKQEANVCYLAVSVLENVGVRPQIFRWLGIWGRGECKKLL